MKMDSYQVLVRPLITEKGIEQSKASNQYPFEVNVKATKSEIRKAVEEVFSVRVRKVCTMMRHGKARRVRYTRGKTRHWKKAVVTLVAGDTIEFI